MKHKDYSFYRLMSKIANQQVDYRSVAHVWPYVQVCVAGTGCESLARDGSWKITRLQNPGLDWTAYQTLLPFTHCILFQGIVCFRGSLAACYDRSWSRFSRSKSFGVAALRKQGHSNLQRPSVTEKHLRWGVILMRTGSKCCRPRDLNRDQLKVQISPFSLETLT